MSRDITKIRNIAIVAHAGAGNTKLAEQILFKTGQIDRVVTGETSGKVIDYEPEELSRNMTLSCKVAYCDYKDYRINIIDTPGFVNFLEDTKNALRVVDGAVVIVSALSGVKAETERIWKYCDDYDLPRVVFVNKLDKENSSFDRAVAEIEKVFGQEAIPLTLPIGEGDNLKGIVDLISLRAILQDGKSIKEAPIPDELTARVEEYRKKFVEKIAELDDSLLEKYLEGQELTEEELIKGLHDASIARRFIPVLAGSALLGIGVDALLDSIILTLPDPKERANIYPIKGINPRDAKEAIRQPDESEPFTGYVFKTLVDPFTGKISYIRIFSGVLKADSNVLNPNTGTKERIGQIYYVMGKTLNPCQKAGPGEIVATVKLKDTLTGHTLCDENNPIMLSEVRFTEPIISFAIAPKTRGDEEKVSAGLHKLLEEDPTLKFVRDEESKDMILSGMGQVHIEVALEKLKRKFGVEVNLMAPKVPYRETIRATARAQGKYKKQSGGRGQYGDCWIEIEPLPRGEGYQFVDKIVGGVIPQQYRPAVEKGILETMKEGILAYYPIIDLKVTLYDGSYHPVDSSEMAFKIAGSMALKKAFMDAKPVLLEPIMKAEIIVPDETLGTVIGDLNARRGKVQGVEPQAGGNQKIIALIPMAEMLTYANQLHSMTSGRGIYSMEFSHYEEVPSHIAQKIIEQRQKERQAKVEE
ncbi:elongation factor G [Thermodesulfovibrio thiophilus]|uniref:elongation factor G n=1 Tax=Thermodesulfovibrio thiophilus TaxID=340095 RepID=UPI000417AE73|nr:elongation factor G [Thermodesulfovibrio thiophilus]HHW19786.1 elongation factor G [Thermodesulfovibrio thiophilus]